MTEHQRAKLFAVGRASERQREFEKGKLWPLRVEGTEFLCSGRGLWWMLKIGKRVSW